MHGRAGSLSLSDGVLARQDTDSVYLLLEFAVGGQLFSLIRSHERLEEHLASRIFSDVASALLYPPRDPRAAQRTSGAHHRTLIGRCIFAPITSPERMPLTVVAENVGGVPREQLRRAFERSHTGPGPFRGSTADACNG